MYARGPVRNGPIRRVGDGPWSEWAYIHLACQDGRVRVAPAIDWESWADHAQVGRPLHYPCAPLSHVALRLLLARPAGCLS